MTLASVIVVLLLCLANRTYAPGIGITFRTALAVGGFNVSQFNVLFWNDVERAFLVVFATTDPVQFANALANTPLGMTMRLFDQLMAALPALQPHEHAVRVAFAGWIERLTAQLRQPPIVGSAASSLIGGTTSAASPPTPRLNNNSSNAVDEDFDENISLAQMLADAPPASAESSAARPENATATRRRQPGSGSTRTHTSAANVFDRWTIDPVQNSALIAQCPGDFRPQLPDVASGPLMFPHVQAYYFSTQNAFGTVMAFKDWRLLHSSGHRTGEQNGVATYTFHCVGAIVCSRSVAGRAVAVQNPAWNVPDDGLTNCTYVQAPTANGGRRVARAQEATVVPGTCPLATCQAPVCIRLPCTAFIKVRCHPNVTTQADREHNHSGPVSIIRVAGTCAHPPVPPVEGVRHTAAHERAAIANFATTNGGGATFASVTQQQLVHARNSDGEPLLSQSLRSNPRIVGEVQRQSTSPRHQSAAPHGTALVQSEVVRLNDQWRAKGVIFEQLEGTGSVHDRRMQCTWYTNAKAAVLRRLLDRHGTVGVLHSDMTFRAIGGSFNLVSVAFYDADCGRFASLFQGLVECHENGGSLDTLGWCNVFFALFRAYPQLIYRGFLLVDRIVMDFEAAERNGFCMALEATVRATTLNEADPNYARNLALSHDINRRDFPPRQSFASLQSEARQYCDDLISAGYIRCRHALAGCDFHLRDNFNRAVSHFDTSNATQENQRSALTADLNILRGRDVAVTLDADQAQQLRDDILQMCENDVYPMRVANWCRTNFANPMCAMWIGVLRIPMYDELIALVDAAAAATAAGGDALLQRLAHQLRIDRAASAQPATNCPIESMNARLQIIVGDGTRRVAVPPAVVCDRCADAMCANDEERDNVRSGRTTTFSRAAQRNTALVAEAISDGRPVPRQNSLQASSHLPHGTRIEYNSSSSGRSATLQTTPVVSAQNQPDVDRCKAALAAIRSRGDSRTHVLTILHVFAVRLLASSSPDTGVILALPPLEHIDSSTPQSTRNLVTGRNRDRSTLHRFINDTGIFVCRPLHEHLGLAGGNSHSSSDASIHLACELRRNVSHAVLHWLIVTIENSLIAGIRMRQHVHNAGNATFDDGLFQCSPWLTERLRDIHSRHGGGARVVHIGAEPRRDEFDLGAFGAVSVESVMNEHHAMPFVRQLTGARPVNRSLDMLDLTRDEDEDQQEEQRSPPSRRRRVSSPPQERQIMIIDDDDDAALSSSAATVPMDDIEQGFVGDVGNSPLPQFDTAQAIRESEAVFADQVNAWVSLIAPYRTAVTHAICGGLSLLARPANETDGCQYLCGRRWTIDAGCRARQECQMSGHLCENCVAGMVWAALSSRTSNVERQHFRELVGSGNLNTAQIEGALLEIALRHGVCQAQCSTTLSSLFQAYNASSTSSNARQTARRTTNRQRTLVEVLHDIIAFTGISIVGLATYLRAPTRAAEPDSDDEPAQQRAASTATTNVQPQATSTATTNVQPQAASTTSTTEQPQAASTTSTTVQPAQPDATTAARRASVPARASSVPPSTVATSATAQTAQQRASSLPPTSQRATSPSSTTSTAQPMQHTASSPSTTIVALPTSQRATSPPQRASSTTIVEQPTSQRATSPSQRATSPSQRATSPPQRASSTTIVAQPTSQRASSPPQHAATTSATHSAPSPVAAGHHSESIGNSWLDGTLAITSMEWAANSTMSVLLVPTLMAFAAPTNDAAMAIIHHIVTAGVNGISELVTFVRDVLAYNDNERVVTNLRARINRSVNGGYIQRNAQEEFMQTIENLVWGMIDTNRSFRTDGERVRANIMRTRARDIPVGANGLKVGTHGDSGGQGFEMSIMINSWMQVTWEEYSIEARCARGAQRIRN